MSIDRFNHKVFFFSFPIYVYFFIYNFFIYLFCLIYLLLVLLFYSYLFILLLLLFIFFFFTIYFNVRLSCLLLYLLSCMEVLHGMLMPPLHYFSLSGRPSQIALFFNLETLSRLPGCGNWAWLACFLSSLHGWHDDTSGR